MAQNDVLLTIWTIGHSTRPIDDFLAVLAAHDIETPLVDVRRFPGSRRLPQFGREALAAALAARDVAYHRRQPHFFPLTAPDDAALGARRP